MEVPESVQSPCLLRYSNNYDRKKFYSTGSPPVCFVFFVKVVSFDVQMHRIFHFKETVFDYFRKTKKSFLAGNDFN
jgi:hypothetical protein